MLVYADPKKVLLRKKQNILTANEAIRELDVKVSAQPIAESQFLIVRRDRVPGFEAAISVHIKAEEAAVTDGICILGIE